MDVIMVRTHNSLRNKASTNHQKGMMNFVTAFALLIALPTSGAMLENMGPQALAGLFTALTAVGGACNVAARALLIGKWPSPKTII